MIVCPFCQGPLTSTEEAQILPEFDHYFQDHTCPACQTKECSLRFNIYLSNDGTRLRLINYWLKWNGYTAVIGVEHPMTEVTKDWWTIENGYTQTTTMCHMIYKSEHESLHITPSNFPDKLKLLMVFQ